MKLNQAQILGERYQIQRQLSDRPGRQTYLALDLQTQILVVLKLIYLSDTLGWDDFKFFEREVQVLQAVSHRAIPQYLDSFDLKPEKGLALVQTYIEARSLAEYLQAGRSFTQAEVEQIAKDLLEVLIYLHERHPPIIHRDLKPSNILLGSRSGNHPGQVYLVDFGSVRTSVQTSSSMTIVGTFGYMPFEQFQGQATPVSDLYSLGMTLIHLVTGTHPADLPQDDFQVEYKALSHVHPIFASWLQWLTQRNPKRRPQSAQIALQALTAISSTPSTSVVGEWKWNSNNWICQSPRRTLQKPQGSRVTVTKSEDIIDIKMPPKKLNFGNWIFGILFYGAFLIPFLSPLWVLITQPGNILMRLCFTLFCGVPIFEMARTFIKPLIERFLSLRWRIERYNFIEEYTLFGWCWRRSESRSAIIKVTYHPTYYRDTGDGRCKVEPKLILHAGICDRTISSNLREVELEWLAYELSNWLDIPIDGSSTESATNT